MAQPYTIIRDGQEEIRYLYGARPFAELLTRAELEQVEHGELIGVSERGAVLALSSPLEEGATVILRRPELTRERERIVTLQAEAEQINDHARNRSSSNRTIVVLADIDRYGRPYNVVIPSIQNGRGGTADVLAAALAQLRPGQALDFEVVKTSKAE